MEPHYHVQQEPLNRCRSCYKRHPLRRPIRAGDTKVNQAVLHQVPTNVINDHRMRDTVLAKLPRCQTGALVTRAGFVNPDVDRDSGVVRLVYRCQCRAPVHSRQPTGITVGQDVDATIF